MSGSGDGTRPTVLLVEDDRTVSTVVSEMLAALGYSVISAESGDEALQCLEAHSTIELALTDLTMPGGISGDQLIPMIEDLRPGVRCIVMSGYISADRRHALMKRPDIVVLPKPFTMAQLKNALEEADLRLP